MIGVSEMNATEVAKKLIHVISSTQSECDWQSERLNPPNTDWLTLVYNYFFNISPGYLSSSSETVEELNKVPLVPGNDGKLHKGGTAGTPLLCADNIAAEIIEAVQYVGVTLVRAPAKLESAIAKFAQRHQNLLVYFLTGPDVLDTVSTEFWDVFFAASSP